MTRMLLVVTGMLALSAPAWAASKDYQVTGPVLAVTADTITVPVSYTHLTLPTN